jgi:hypothetical protein
MFTKHISELNYNDINDLVNIQNEQEGNHLDFKQEIGSNLEKAKKELAKDISAFANSGGGYLVIGVTDKYEIVGIEKTIQNKPIDEWINQILSSNIEPHLFYYDPKIIEIPNSELVLLVIHVPESMKKPHIVTELNNYYIRINDSCKPANHNQIRDMFEFSRNRTDEFNDFLRKRNLLDENNSDFGVNNNSKQLSSEVPLKTSSPKPIILISLIPKYPDEERFNIPHWDLINWLDKNSSGYNPIPNASIYSTHQAYDIKFDGILLQHDANIGLVSYFEILSSGYVEAGLSAKVAFPYPKDKGESFAIALDLTPIIGYEMQILGFAKKLYTFMKYYDEILLQISFVNVQNLNLHGLNQDYRRVFENRRGDIINKHHKSFKLNYRFKANTLSEADILSIAKLHSEKICRAFGLPEEYCFKDDQLDIYYFSQNSPW